MKPLLTLCMIVKDEAHGIARTLRSVVPFVDRIVIVDTGSTDDTKSIIWEEWGDDAAGAVFDAPFVDFATTRNVLLQRATEAWGDDQPTEFLLLLDADDILEGGEALRAWLETYAELDAFPLRMVTIPEGAKMIERDGSLVVPPEECQIEIVPPEEAFMLSMSEGSTVWSSARVVRASAVGAPEPEEHDQYCDGWACAKCSWKPGWHYVGAVHEVLVHPSGRQPTITIPGVHIRHERGPVSAERTRARWERDAELLRAAVEANPEDARATFYLARTLRQLGRTDEASEMFGRRIALGGWLPEVFESHLEMARIWAGDARIVPLALLRAHALEPHRAEPLCDLADHFRRLDQHGPAFTFASRAMALQVPGEGLFIDRDAYAWRAAALAGISGWYVGEYQAGEAACRRALEAGPPEEWRRALVANLGWYVARRAADGRAEVPASAVVVKGRRG